MSIIKKKFERNKKKLVLIEDNLKFELTYFPFL